MSYKKKVAVEAATKQQFKSKMIVYIERYREIELYLTLLTKPLLPNLLPTTAVGTEELYDKVEAEIKTFLEQKLQILTGLAQPAGETAGLSKDEVAALKMVASKILNTSIPKEIPQVTPAPVVRAETVIEAEDDDESDDDHPSEPEVVMETENVVVEQREQSPIAKRKKRAQKVVGSREVVQGVTLGEPTDTMKRVRPMGVKPLPPPSESQLAAMAAAQEQMLNAQMDAASTMMDVNRGAANLVNPYR